LWSNPDKKSADQVCGCSLGDILVRRRDLWTEERPVAGLSKMFNQVMARGSNSLRPHISQTQAGKFGTVTNSVFNQVK
jgi:hypothetical protein